MSLKLGTTTIAGASKETTYISNAHHLLDFKWSDCIMNDVSWLRADTFSWQSGDAYVTAYSHLVQDIQNITAETETIGSYTITFYRATDGHKICLANQETTVANIYSETGIAWYYIVDTTNTRFKLPRTKFGFEGLRTNVGDLVEAGLPDHYHNVPYYAGTCAGGSAAQRFGWSSPTNDLATKNASESNPIYGNSTTVQEPATQMYLYFYVGDYTQTAVEQTAGLNSELFNGKADIDLSNCTKPHIVETYISSDGLSWYRVYSDGWCEQGGFVTGTWQSVSDITINLLKEYINTNYSVTTTALSRYSGTNPASITFTKNTSSMDVNLYGISYSSSDTGFNWECRGYIR